MKADETTNMKPKTNQGINEVSKENPACAFTPLNSHADLAQDTHMARAPKATAVTKGKGKWWSYVKSSVCHLLIWSQDRGGRTQPAVAVHYVML